jgi:hypothetical protein
VHARRVEATTKWAVFLAAALAASQAVAPFDRRAAWVMGGVIFLQGLMPEKKKDGPPPGDHP